jgi:hypothetical protein
MCILIGIGLMALIIIFVVYRPSFSARNTLDDAASKETEQEIAEKVAKGVEDAANGKLTSKGSFSQDEVK